MPETPLPDETGGPDNRTLKRVGVGAAIVALLVVAAGTASRLGATNDVRDIAAEAAVPTVAVVEPQGGASAGDLVLPGNVQAYNTAAIYARTNGYVRRWLAEGKVPGRQEGRRWHIPRDEMIALVERT